MPVSVVGAGSVGTSGSDATVSFTLPATIPANSVCWLATNINVVTLTVSSISNLTETQVDVLTDVGTTLTGAMYRAPVGPADEGLTVTVTWSGFGKPHVCWIVLSGAVEVQHGFNVLGDNTTDTSATLPSITPTIDRAFLINFTLGQHPSTTTITKDADWTDQSASAFGTQAVPVQSGHVYTMQLATGPGVARSGDVHTWSVASRDLIWVVAIQASERKLVKRGNQAALVRASYY